MTDYGERLMLARKRAGLTQMQLAKKIGLSQGTIASAESTASASTFIPQLAKALGVDAYWLATGIGEMEVGGPKWPFKEASAAEIRGLTLDELFVLDAIVGNVVTTYQRLRRLKASEAEMAFEIPAGETGLPVRANTNFDYVDFTKAQPNDQNLQPQRKTKRRAV